MRRQGTHGMALGAVCVGLALLMTLISCRPGAAAPESDGGRQDPQAVKLLEEAARRNAHIATLSADFRQEKQLGILTRPLISQGYMCVTKDRVLWAYTDPAPAGFLYENGQGRLWDTSPAAKRPASAQEAGAITALVKQILAWIQIDAKALQQTYRLERPDPDTPALLLFPLRPAFFSKVETLFTPDLGSLRRLTFFEANGDVTRILFADTRINQPLPERCAP